ncbi:hypothetical protein C4D60_Mb02t14040 [Musa balbisiana]|uniref:Uncharacterized protein n=1 Tax=Musa balbisiana TaxID=52838 RepID=A0A4S8IBX3_MUSBA|nr:hypothetical protein C4D60_Mb02t14040 [Musa balbisiana]
MCFCFSCVLKLNVSNRDSNGESSDLYVDCGWICLKQTVQSHPPRLSANFFEASRSLVSFGI